MSQDQSRYLQGLFIVNTWRIAGAESTTGGSNFIFITVTGSTVSEGPQRSREIHLAINQDKIPTFIAHLTGAAKSIGSSLAKALDPNGRSELTIATTVSDIQASA